MCVGTREGSVWVQETRTTLQNVRRAQQAIRAVGRYKLAKSVQNCSERYACCNDSVTAAAYSLPLFATIKTR